MAQYHNLQPEAESYELEYSESQGENGCKFPRYPKRPDANRYHYLILFLISFAICHVHLRTDNNGFDLESPEYALHKNTRFEECYNAPALEAGNNCTAIKAMLLDGNRGYVNFEDQGLATLPRTELKYRQRSYKCRQLDSLLQWLELLFAMWQYRKRYIASYSNTVDPCKGIGWDDWLVHAYDLVSLTWWRIHFGLWAKDPTRALTPSIVGWITPWKYSDILRYHPYSCVLRDSPKVVRGARWTLNLVAAAQWVISMHISRSLRNKNSGHVAYDCLASRIPGAPGASTCSAQQICSKDWLFHSPKFLFFNGGSGPEMGVLILFIVTSVVFESMETLPGCGRCSSGSSG
ncbi:hypothetical protein AJ80_07716 [Polytolypa hystricis UAMH7299]|uniref:Uncharacterized protein n=1 Tax=Polytolypa hystricis (strain UAMH7299) TaxID=1447883 RepID=A0A2B7XJY0_POLH7|nr:hypothetical protein AJ80_07716 [Polytolypa hystricis UAMH7299]